MTEHASQARIELSIPEDDLILPFQADQADVVGRGEYGERFVSIVERANVMGAQFHPEKSSLDGLALLRNFVGVRVAA